jgi:hypothetical protein
MKIVFMDKLKKENGAGRHPAEPVFRTSSDSRRSVQSTQEKFNILAWFMLDSKDLVGDPICPKQEEENLGYKITLPF